MKFSDGIKDLSTHSEPALLESEKSVFFSPANFSSDLPFNQIRSRDKDGSSPKVLITTVPFGEQNSLPLELLKSAGIDVSINPVNRKLKEEELAEIISEFDFVIAGTERIGLRVFKRADRLKFISRVGIGLDGVDLLEAKKRNIQVSYTPDAPAPAVAELTIGMMLTLLRQMHIANQMMHENKWQRLCGRRVSEVTIGIMGTGRIGGRVLRRLAAFGSPRILVNDLCPSSGIADALKLEWVDKQTILEESDLVSIHLPLTCQTKNMIRYHHLKAMKPDAVIINTSRGGIINEDDLATVLAEGHLSGVGIDVFEQEPYTGPLQKYDRCLLTSHMGSMSIDCRSQMEIEATQEVIRFFKGKSLKNLVPQSEYHIQSRRLQP